VVPPGQLPPSLPAPDVAVLGGSGFYSFLDPVATLNLETPFGEPAGPVTVGLVDGRSVAFLARHGPGHRFPAHRVPYRANMWALRSVGVRQVLAPCAVGSLKVELGPGALVVPDQVLDRTRARDRSYYDEGAVHVPFAEPYCPVGRRAVLEGAFRSGWHATPDGTMAVIEGPRFSSRAESRELAAAGATVVNMTGMPEAALARELALCYTSVALVTDRDAGVDEGTGVTMAEVFALFAEHTERLKTLLAEVAATLPTTRTCPCVSALDGIDLPVELP
jgi:5'-methylthioadenosine phosphorylase